jgi:hypothetical protein
LVPHAPESAGAQPAAASDVPAALRTRAPASTQHVSEPMPASTSLLSSSAAAFVVSTIFSCKFDASTQ